MKKEKIIGTRKFGQCILGMLVCIALLTGCGSSHSEDTIAKGVYDSYKESGGSYQVYDEVAMEAEVTEAEETSSVEVPEQGRKLIKTYHLSVETLAFDTLVETIQSNVEQFGGYIENSEIYTDSHLSTKNGNFTIRIPKEQAKAFLSDVEANANVTSISENVEDVTLSYVDLDSHKKALQTEQERLLALLEQAETVEDLISIEERLSEVRYQIGSMESQLRTYDNRINYTTIYLNLREVKKVTEPEDDTFIGRICKGFMNNLENATESVVDVIVWFITGLPYLVIWVIGIGIAIKIIKVIRKKYKFKKSQMKNLGPEKENGEKEL